MTKSRILAILGQFLGDSPPDYNLGKNVLTDTTTQRLEQLLPSVQPTAPSRNNLHLSKSPPHQPGVHGIRVRHLRQAHQPDTPSKPPTRGQSRTQPHFWRPALVNDPNKRFGGLPHINQEQLDPRHCVWTEYLLYKRGGGGFVLWYTIYLWTKSLSSCFLLYFYPLPS